MVTDITAMTNLKNDNLDLGVAFYQIVDSVVQEYYQHLNKAQLLERTAASTKRKTLLIAILIGVTSIAPIPLYYVFYLIAFNINKSMGRFSTQEDVNSWTNAHAGQFLLLGLVVGFVLSILISIIVQKIRNKEADEIMKKAYAEMEAVNQIATENRTYITALPPSYRYPLATNYIYTLFRDRRVTSLNEALAMYDEQLHRWNMENMSRKIMLEQQRQTSLLGSIAASSALSAFSDTINLITG